MTDWDRVERLRRKGRSWKEIADDPRVRFDGGSGPRATRLLKAGYVQRGARDRSLAAHVGARRARGSPGLSRRGLVVLGAIVAVVAALALYVATQEQNLGRPTGWVGRVAPDFTLPSTGGTSFTLSQERNHTSVLLFFNEGLSCSPCLNQMVELDHDAGKFAALGVQVAQITGDTLSQMKQWASQAGISNTTILADPTLGVCNTYDTTGAAVSMMPGIAPGHTFVLVDKSGTVVWRGDYGPYNMSVPDSTILQAAQVALAA